MLRLIISTINYIYNIRRRVEAYNKIREKLDISSHNNPRYLKMLVNNQIIRKAHTYHRFLTYSALLDMYLD